MDEPLFDKNHKIIGYIGTMGSTGKQIVMDKDHHIIGYYNPETNVAMDKDYNIIGYGSYSSYSYSKNHKK